MPCNPRQYVMMSDDHPYKLPYFNICNVHSVTNSLSISNTIVKYFL